MYMTYFGISLFLLLLAVFIYVWTIYNRPLQPNLTDDDLKRIDLDDKRRQWTSQFFGGAALLATFAFTVYQTFESQRQWSHDYQLRQFTAALDALKETDSTERIAGLYALHAVAVTDPARYEREVAEILVATIRKNAARDLLNGFSKECKGPLTLEAPRQQDREEANLEVQVAMNLLANRQKDLDQSSSDTYHKDLLRLTHLFLDDLDLTGSDLPGAFMSQSHFRRVSFRDARLERADFRGADFADYHSPGFPNDGRPDNWLYLNTIDHEDENGEYVWRRYRCWVADFRNAHLEGATFDGAALGGADFTGASFDERTSFCHATLSRANFTGVKGLSPGQLETGCADEKIVGQPDVNVPPCSQPPNCPK
jgi:uncharacterized protein YjbI with pentapeptide repeats